MRRVSGNPAKRAAAAKTPGKKNATTTRKNTGKKTAPAPAKKQLRFIPRSRAAWRLTLLASWIIIAGIAIPTGYLVGKNLNDEYTFVMIAFTLPLTLVVALSIPFFALAAKGGLSKIPRIGFDEWPVRRGRILIAALAIAAAGTLITAIQYVYGNTPVGLLLVGLLALAAAIRDTIHVIKSHRKH